MSAILSSPWAQEYMQNPTDSVSIYVLPVNKVWSLRSTSELVYLLIEGGDDKLQAQNGNSHFLLTKRGLIGSKYQVPIIGWKLVLGEKTGSICFEGIGFTVYCPLPQLKNTLTNPKEKTFAIFNTVLKPGQYFTDTVFGAVDLVIATKQHTDAIKDLRDFFTTYNSVFDSWMENRLKELNGVVEEKTDQLNIAKHYAPSAGQVFFVSGEELNFEVPFGCYTGEDCFVTLSEPEPEPELEQPIQRPKKTLWTILNSTPNKIIATAEEKLTELDQLWLPYTYESPNGELTTHL